MNKKKTSKHKTSWREYSKVIIVAMVVLWFTVAIYGAIITGYQLTLTPDSVNIDGLFSYVGLPMTGGIVTYLIKSAVENKKKIKNSAEQDSFEDCGEEVIDNE